MSKKTCPLAQALDELERRRQEYYERTGEHMQYVFTGPPDLNTNYTADPAHPGDASQWYSSAEMKR